MTTSGVRVSLCILFVTLCPSLYGQQIAVKGRVVDSQGKNLSNASVQVFDRAKILGNTTAGTDGRFQIGLSSTGRFIVKVEASGFRPVEQVVTVTLTGNGEIAVIMTQLSSPTENVTVTADVNETDLLSPDPAEKVFVTQDLLDANPGRPGAPVSIPGYPIETASSGIKAPQYFAPGVAGDHREPIAQYISIGPYLMPNNLSANAHGNGYADPNILIPAVIDSVKVDGGAYDVREGNHSVNLSETYGLRSALDPFITITADYRDVDVVAGYSPSPKSWVAFEASLGDGFLERLEHRQQYKFNGERLFHRGHHQLTLFVIGYYGRSYVPGLVPIFSENQYDSNFPNYGDTIDPRQKDQTHTATVALNDVWQLSRMQQLQLSGFFRTYNLSLYSDFGEGLIRQSEFRTETGGSVNYVNNISGHLSLLGGFDYNREAPRDDNLDHYGFYDPSQPDYYGPPTAVDSSNVTIASYTPYVAAEGAVAPHFRYYLGWRRDEINIGNEDLLHSTNSIQGWIGVNSPKATVSFQPGESWHLPLISFSYGQSFFTEDPRLGTGTTIGSPVATARSYQLVASKTILKTDFRLTLGHVTSSAELAKIDPDTGLQFDEGPARLRFLTATVRRNFNRGSLLLTFSKADARDLDSGQPTPEAPRTIFDVLGAIQKLPWHLQARGELEFVGVKPLGTGCDPANLNADCTAVSVEEFRGAVVRPFQNGRFAVGVNFLIASGFTGQTTETFCQDIAPPTTCDPSNVAEVVGVRIPSYASLTFTYRFGRSSVP